MNKKPTTIFLLVLSIGIILTSYGFSSHVSGKVEKSDNLKQVLLKYENQIVYAQGLQAPHLTGAKLIEIGDDYLTLMPRGTQPQDMQPVYIPFGNISSISPAPPGVTIWFK